MLYQDHRPKTISEMLGNEKTLAAFEKHFTVKTHSRVHCIIGPRGCGKAQPMYSKVLTPTGWKTMGDMQPGMEVISGDGEVTQVLGVFPQGERPIYEISLNDGTAFRVADNHINRVTYKNPSGKMVCADLDTLSLIEKVAHARPDQGGIRIPNPIIHASSKKPLPIHPYLLGVLIGDGALSSGNFGVCLPEADVRAKVETLLNIYGFTLHRIREDRWDYNICRDTERYPTVQDMKDDSENLKNQVTGLCLNCKSTEKHIPEEYLHTSVEERLELLRGLFDTDGHVSASKSRRGDVCIRYEYSTSSAKLSHDFAYLVRSLGITDAVSARKTHYTHNGEVIPCNISYRHCLKIPNSLTIASSAKHLSRIKARQCGEALSRKIVAIRPVGVEPCQCIYVAAECHTYITDNMTVTHNTTLARIAATTILGAVENMGIQEVNCGTERGVAAMKDVIDMAPYRPPVGNARVIILDEAHSLLAPGKKALLKPTEDTPPYTYWFFCTTDPDTLFAGDAGSALKSRMTFWKLKALTKTDITKLVTDAAKKYEINLAPEALGAIVNGCNGVPREALVMLEQAITGDPMVAEESKKDTAVIDFCRALYKAVGVPEAWPTLGAQLANLKKQGVMMEAIRHTALAYATTTLIARSEVACLRLIEHLSEPVYDQGEAFPKMAAQVFKLCHLRPDQL